MAQAHTRPAKTPSSIRARGAKPVVIKTVGVIGAGQMGNGIAHVAALAGYKVLLNDLSKERVESGACDDTTAI